MQTISKVKYFAIASGKNDKRPPKDFQFSDEHKCLNIDVMMKMISVATLLKNFILSDKII